MSINQDEIWYAVKQTRIVHAPEKKLETFGETQLRYYLVSELMDQIGKIRIRDGLVSAQRPRLITPNYLAQRLTENFGSEANEYADWLIRSGEVLRLLEYGLSFQKGEHREEIVSGDLDSVATNIVRQQPDENAELYAVIVGVDDLWEVSLLRFISRLVQNSVPGNFKDLSGRGLLDASGESGIPTGVRIELENDFHAARGNPDRIKRLGRKLQDFGVFAEYEDRLYGLLRELT